MSNEPVIESAVPPSREKPRRTAPRQFSHRGKFGRLPQALREQVNEKLRDGLTGAEIADWLNEQPQVRQCLEGKFDNPEFTHRNIDEWRGDGHQRWLRAQTKLEHVRHLSEYSLELAVASGGSVSAGAIAILGGRLLELIEAAEEDADVLALAAPMVAVRQVELEKEKVELTRSKVKLLKAQEARRGEAFALDQLRFQRETMELFLKWQNDPRAREILDSNEKKSVKMDRLLELLFGKPIAATI